MKRNGVQAIIKSRHRSIVSAITAVSSFAALNMRYAVRGFPPM